MYHRTWIISSLLKATKSLLILLLIAECVWKCGFASGAPLSFNRQPSIGESNFARPNSNVQKNNNGNRGRGRGNRNSNGGGGMAGGDRFPPRSSFSPGYGNVQGPGRTDAASAQQQQRLYSDSLGFNNFKRSPPPPQQLYNFRQPTQYSPAQISAYPRPSNAASVPRHVLQPAVSIDNSPTIVFPSQSQIAKPSSISGDVLTAGTSIVADDPRVLVSPPSVELAAANKNSVVDSASAVPTQPDSSLAVGASPQSRSGSSPSNMNNLPQQPINDSTASASSTSSALKENSNNTETVQSAAGLPASGSASEMAAVVMSPGSVGDNTADAAITAARQAAAALVASPVSVPQLARDPGMHSGKRKKKVRQMAVGPATMARDSASPTAAEQAQLAVEKFDQAIAKMKTLSPSPANMKVYLELMIMKKFIENQLLAAFQNNAQPPADQPAVEKTEPPPSPAEIQKPSAAPAPTPPPSVDDDDAPPTYDE